MFVLNLPGGPLLLRERALCWRTFGRIAGKRSVMSQEKPKGQSLTRRATAMLPRMRNPLDVDGDGVVSRSDFVPNFLDRDGDGHFGFGDKLR